MELNSDSYILFVREQANKQGKDFFLDVGEGRDFIDPITGMYVEDLSGWLFDLKDETEIQKFMITPRERLFDLFSNYFFAVWTKEEDGQISINFIKASDY